MNTKTYWDYSNLEDEFLNIFDDIFIKTGSLLRVDNIISSRSYLLYSICKKASLMDGDFVECGTYLGSSAAFMAASCKTTLHLFDSWEGVSSLTEFDNNLYLEQSFKCDINSAKKNLSKYNNINFYKGWIPERFNEIENKSFSVVHIDVDLYEPTKASIEFFWPKIIPGGFMVIDFHDGNSHGVKKAANDYFKEDQIDMFLTEVAVIKK